MILKKEYKTKNIISSTVIDNIERYDEGTLEDGTKFINIYRKGSQNDAFETIEIKNMSIFIMSNEGKTIQIYRG